MNIYSHFSLCVGRLFLKCIMCLSSSSMNRYSHFCACVWVGCFWNASYVYHHLWIYILISLCVCARLFLKMYHMSIIIYEHIFSFLSLCVCGVGCFLKMHHMCLSSSMNILFSFLCVSVGCVLKCIMILSSSMNILISLYVCGVGCFEMHHMFYHLWESSEQNSNLCVYFEMHHMFIIIIYEYIFSFLCVCVLKCIMYFIIIYEHIFSFLSLSV